MKKEELIEKLQAMPEGIEVCVYDWRENAIMEEANGVGIYSDFQIEIVDVDEDFAEAYPEEANAFNEWCAIGFDSGEKEPMEMRLFEAVVQKHNKGTKFRVYTFEDPEQDARVYFTGKFNKEHYTVISVNEVELI